MSDEDLGTGDDIDVSGGTGSGGDVDGGQGASGSGEDWKSVFGESGASLTFKTPDDMLTSFNEAQAMIRRSIRIPTEDASEEDHKAFLEKLTKVDGVVALPKDDDPESKAAFNAMMGIPEKADDYKFDELEGSSQAVDDSIRRLAHEAGLNNEQAGVMRKFLAENMSASEREKAEINQRNMEELKREWGNAFDDRKKLSGQAASYFDTKIDGFKDWLDTTGMGDDPMLIRMMNVIGDMSSEEQAFSFDDYTGGMTPADAKMQISDIRNNPKHPFNNPMDSAHEEAKKKVRELYTFAYPKK